MHNYEKLLQDTLDRALTSLSEQATEKGYDGVVGLKIAHPTIMNGCAEVVIYGNGFRYGNEKIKTTGGVNPGKFNTSINSLSKPSTTKPNLSPQFTNVLST